MLHPTLYIHTIYVDMYFPSFRLLQGVYIFEEHVESQRWLFMLVWFPNCVLLFVLREKGLNAFVVCFQGECTKVLKWHDKTWCFWSKQLSRKNRVDLLECSQAPAHRNWQHKATCCNLWVPHTFWKTDEDAWGLQTLAIHYSFWTVHSVYSNKN